MRRAAKVDQSQPDIVKALRTCGDYVAIIGRPVDLLIRTCEIYWTAECKTPGPNARREMPIQIEHREDAERHHAPHFILKSAAEAIAIRNKIVERT